MRPQIARSVRTLGRRANSTQAAKEAVNNAAASAKETAAETATKAQKVAGEATGAAKEAASKAQDAAVKAKDVAGENVNKAVEATNQYIKSGTEAFQRVAGPAGEKVGNMLGSYKGPIVYNWQVFTSFCRQVYQAERLAPPMHLSQWTSAYAQIFHYGTSPQWWSKSFASGAWAKVAVAGVEAYGLYKIGEIIGRRNLVGYKSSAPHH